MASRQAVLAAICLFSLLSGCTIPLHTTIPLTPDVAVVPAKVEVVIPPDRAVQTYERNGMIWIGMVWTWRFEIGQELSSSAGKVLRLFFTQVDTNRQSRKGAGGYLLTAEPMIETFHVSAGSMKTTVAIRYVITDSSGKIVWQNTVQGKSKMGVHQWMGILFGVFAGQIALSDSASDAFNFAYQAMIEDLKKAAQQGAFKLNG